ncbi:MAG: flagellar type III secretion system pore protein FliP [Panacagrimonas sp.]
MNRFGLIAIGLLLVAGPGLAQTTGLPALTVTPGANGGSSYSLSIQVLMLMTLITLLPSILLMMTAFTRIIIVLGLLRQALGTGQTPSNPVLIGLALFMTLFVMQPVVDRIYTDAVTPYLDGKMEAKLALETAATPIREFMLRQTRDSDLMTFARISKSGPFNSPEDIPFTVLVAAFVTSELSTAFQIGFLLFIPFIVIDLVISSVLMSMGMMMLSPMLVSAPFKLMLFVMVDGWALLMASLAGSFTT